MKKKDEFSFELVQMGNSCERVASETMRTDEKAVLNSVEDAVNKLGKLLPEIDIKNGLMFCGDDKDFYIECMGDFAALTIKSDLAAAMEEKDYRTYCVHAHGFKNNAYTIGAAELGNLAYEMEKLTKEGWSEEIYDKQTELFEKYDKICKIYEEIASRLNGN